MLVVYHIRGAFLEIILILNERKPIKNTENKIHESQKSKHLVSAVHFVILTLAQNITGKMLKQTYMYT